MNNKPPAIFPIVKGLINKNNNNGTLQVKVLLCTFLYFYIYIFNIYILYSYIYIFIRILRLLRRTGMSLVVQWLRLHAPNSGDLGSIPGQGTRSQRSQLKIPSVKMKMEDPVSQLRPSTAK